MIDRPKVDSKWPYRSSCIEFWIVIPIWRRGMQYAVYTIPVPPPEAQQSRNFIIQRAKTDDTLWQSSFVIHGTYELVIVGQHDTVSWFMIPHHHNLASNIIGPSCERITGKNIPSTTSDAPQHPSKENINIDDRCSCATVVTIGIASVARYGIVRTFINVTNTTTFLLFLFSVSYHTIAILPGRVMNTVTRWFFIWVMSVTVQILKQLPVHLRRSTVAVWSESATLIRINHSCRVSWRPQQHTQHDFEVN